MTSSFNISRRKESHIDLYGESPGFATNREICPSGYAQFPINTTTDWKLCMPMPKVKDDKVSIVQRDGTRRNRLYDFKVNAPQPQVNPIKDRWDEWITLYSDAVEREYLKYPKKYDGTGLQYVQQIPPNPIYL